MIGKTLGHYHIVEKLGEGGMGVVYKARDTHLDRFVALKVLPPERVADPDRKRRFVLEAKAASALNHPNIVTSHDIDTADGVDFIAMEFIEGPTLAQAGESGEARALIDRLSEIARTAYVPPSSFAWIHLGLGDIDEAFTWMDRAVDGRDPMMIPIKSFPFLDPFRADARYHALLRKMNLEEQPGGIGRPTASGHF
jgi:hypothetical protein